MRPGHSASPPHATHRAASRLVLSSPAARTEAQWGRGTSLPPRTGPGTESTPNTAPPGTGVCWTEEWSREEGHRGSEQHLPPPGPSPERHGEPHAHHHQRDAPIFRTETGKEVPPNLGGAKPSWTVAVLTSGTFRAPCFCLATSLGSPITSPAASPASLPLSLSHSLPSLHHPLHRYLAPEAQGADPPALVPGPCV